MNHSESFGVGDIVCLRGLPWIVVDVLFSPSFTLGGNEFFYRIRRGRTLRLIPGSSLSRYREP